jgi:hypothetical protein
VRPTTDVTVPVILGLAAAAARFTSSSRLIRPAPP